MGEEHFSDEQLIAYAAGELNKRESAGLAAHLRGCATCGATVARFKKVREILRNDDSVEPPPAIVARARAIFRHFSYEQLIGYAAGESDIGESADVAVHLTTCADCATIVARFRTVRQLVRGDFGTDPPQATLVRAQSILRRQRTAPQPRRAEIGWLQVLFPRVRPLIAATLALLFFAFLLALGHTGIDSSEAAIPGDGLYAFKLDTEGAQIALSLDPVGKAQLLLGLTEKRVDEMVALNANGRDEYIPDTATRYENLTNQVMGIVRQLAQAHDSRAIGLGAAADTVLSRNTGILTILLDKVTEQVRSAIGNAISVSQNDQSAILNAVATMTNPPTPTPTGTSTRAPAVVSTSTRPRVPAGQTPVPAGQTSVPVGQTAIPPSQQIQPPVQPSAPPAPPPPKVQPSATPVPPTPNEQPGRTKTPPGQQTKFARTPASKSQ